MKHTKRLLALLLALIMAFSLALPVLADDAPNPAMPVITKQPQSVDASSKQFVLTIEAEILNGDPIGYQWYNSITKEPIPGATEAEYSGNSSQFELLCCIVYNMNDSTAETGPHRVVSKIALFYPLDMGESLLETLYNAMIDENGLKHEIFRKLHELNRDGKLFKWTSVLLWIFGWPILLPLVLLGIVRI